MTDCKSKLWDKCGLNREYQIICENGYKPVFEGINDIDGMEEHKLYFISKALSFKNTEILEWTEKLAISLEGDHVISLNEFRQLYDMGLFAEEIAFSAHRRGVWRLYFSFAITYRNHDPFALEQTSVRTITGISPRQ